MLNEKTPLCTCCVEDFETLFVTQRRLWLHA